MTDETRLDETGLLRSARSRARQRTALAALLGAWAVVGVSGCEQNRDPRFAAETYDEYTEPLTNAVIGTPTGTLIVSDVGVVTDGGMAGTGGATGAADA